MELSKEMHEALCAHLNLELFSSYLYRVMSCEFAAEGLSGFAWWLKCQKVEEDYHANKFEEYLKQRGVKPMYSDIRKPMVEYLEPMQYIEAILAHEKTVTESVDKLMEMADGDEGDYATQCFLKWFVGEQVEEEAQVRHILKALETAGGTGYGLLHVDRELGQRKHEHHDMEADGY